jgi:hypothetical protein
MIEGHQGFLGIQITQQKHFPQGLQARHEGLLERYPGYCPCGAAGTDAAEPPSRQQTFLNRLRRGSVAKFGRGREGGG